MWQNLHLSRIVGSSGCQSHAPWTPNITRLLFAILWLTWFGWLLSDLIPRFMLPQRLRISSYLSTGYTRGCYAWDLLWIHARRWRSNGQRVHDGVWFASELGDITLRLWDTTLKRLISCINWQSCLRVKSCLYRCSSGKYSGFNFFTVCIDDLASQLHHLNLSYMQMTPNGYKKSQILPTR